MSNEPSKNFAPDRRYEPSSTPLDGASSYSGAYQKWAPKQKEALPWADVAKQRTNILHKANTATENSCYSTDYPGTQVVHIHMSHYHYES